MSSVKVDYSSVDHIQQKCVEFRDNIKFNLQDEFITKSVVCKSNFDLHYNPIRMTLVEEWQKRLFSDLCFVTSDKKLIHAHKIVLGALSDYMKEMLVDINSVFDITLILPDISSKELNIFLCSVYEGSISESSINKNFCDIAKLFGINTIKRNIDDTTLNENDEQTSIHDGIDIDVNLSPLEETQYNGHFFDVPGPDVIIKHEEQHRNKMCNVCGEFVENMALHISENHTLSTLTEGALEWNYFVKNPTDSNRVVCRECNIEIRFDLISDIKSNIDQDRREDKTKSMIILKHLRHAHPQIYHMVTLKNISIAESFCISRNTGNIWKFYRFLENDESSGPPRHQCTMCEEMVGSVEEALAHIENDHPNQFRKFHMNTLPLFKYNIKWYFKKLNPNKFRCKCCLAEICISKLDDHLSEVHPEFSHTGVTQPLPDQFKRKPRSLVWLYFKKLSKDSNLCLHCNKILISRNQTTTNMIKHLELNHVEQYESFNQATVQNSKLKNSKIKSKKLAIKLERSEDPQQRTCTECKKIYSCRPSMLYHKKVVHSGIRPFRCDKCDVTFARAGSFNAHSHSKTRSFLCPVCGKTFARKHIRDIHERAHYGERRYACSFCEKRFLTNQQKSNHERVHTGERPFQCTDCGRQFAQQHQLTTHLRIHTGEKPYECDNCTQVFRHLSSRNNHKCSGKLNGTTNHDSLDPVVV